MICNVIATGSKGNAVLINNSILIDCGVPFRELEPYWRDLRLVLLTHIHGDHFNARTIQKLHAMRPALWFAVPAWLIEPLERIGIDRRVLVEAGTDYWQTFPFIPASVRCVPIPHDVQNCAWYITANDEKMFYATDCGSLDGVYAPGYDLYLLEANYGEKEIQERMKRKLEAGEFCYESRAIESHLSREQAKCWLAQNAAIGKSQVIYLHQHQDEEASHDTMGTSL